MSVYITSLGSGNRVAIEHRYVSGENYREQIKLTLKYYYFTLMKRDVSPVNVYGVQF